MNRVGRNLSWVLLLALSVGIIVPAAGIVSISPTTLSFGNQVVGTTSSAKTVTLTNGLSQSLTISNIGITGDFAIVNNLCGPTLAAGKKCTVGVTFHPTALGTRSGTLTVSDSASNSPQTVGLSGSGVPPSLTSIAILPANPTIPLGRTQQFTATGKFNDGTTQDLTNTAAWSSSAAGVATINATGLATSVAQGRTTITATSGAISTSTRLTVGPPALVSIAVTPANPSIPLGNTAQFTATGTYTNGSTQNLSSSATWSSSVTTVATINSAGLAASVAQGQTTITATSGAISGSAQLTVSPPALVSIAVTPANPSIPLGNTLQFTATGTYTNGSTQNLSSSATWSSSVTTVATINSTGLAASVAEGQTIIGATSGAISGSTKLTVSPALVSIAVTPASPSIPLGNTAQFTATGTYTNGSTQNLSSSATWSSSLTSVATINSTGLAASVAQGQTTITATSGAVSGSAQLTVGPPALVSIAVTPANPSIVLGNTFQFTATGTYTNSSTQDLSSSATWSSSAQGIATINNSGLASSVGLGQATISATSGAVTGSTTLTIASTSQSLISAVAGQNAGVVGTYPVSNLAFAHNVTAGNQIIVAEKVENFNATAISSTPSKVSGTATIGSFTLDAANDGMYASSSSQHYYYALRVWRAPVTGSGTLTLSFPASAANYLVVAIDEFSGMNASPVDGTPVTKTGTGSTESTGNVVTSKAGMVLELSSEFSSSNFTYTQSDTNIYQAGQGASTATGEAQYKITSGAGTYNLSADNGVNNRFWLSVGVAYSAVTVGPPTLVSIAVTPANTSIPLGNSAQFTAMGTYTDGSTQNLSSSATWSSSAQGVATVNNSGLASSVGLGQTTIGAASGLITGSTTLTVATAQLVSITVTPANPTITQGIALHFTATGNYGDGSTQDITNAVGWASTNALVATVNASGLVTAVGTGSTSIAAVGGAISGSITLNVAASTAISGLPAGRFVYTADDLNNVTGFAQGVSGVLSNLSGSPYSTGGGNPSAMVVDPSGKFALVVNVSSSNVSVFSIDSVSGALTPVPGSPFSGSSSMYALAVHPSGKFVYVTNQFAQNITAYNLNSQTGALSEISGSPFASNSNPEGLAIDPKGKYLFAATQDGNVQAYTVDAVTGVLTPMSGSPFSLGGGGEVPLVVVDPSGRFLYVARATTNEIVALNIDAGTGALSPVPGSPFTAGSNPGAIVVDRTGNFLYVINSSDNNITGYVIDAATGRLLPMVGSPFSTGTYPKSLVVDSSNKFVYVANLSSQAVSAYSLDASTGALTAVSGSPFGPSGGASAIAATAGPATLQSPISAVSGQNAGVAGTKPVSNLAFAHNVTAGNQIIVAEKVDNFNATAIPSTPTKVSGTATIGSFTQDAANDGMYAYNSSQHYYFALRVWRAPVTGSGTLTLSFPVSAANYLVVAIDEFSGMDASPVDGTPVTKTGTGSTESTGNVVTSKAGMVLELSSEFSSSNFTYTQSDTNIYQAGQGAITTTGEAQYKITSAAGTYNLTANNGVNNPFWISLGVAYSAATSHAELRINNDDGSQSSASWLVANRTNIRPPLNPRRREFLYRGK